MAHPGLACFGAWLLCAIFVYVVIKNAPLVDDEDDDSEGGLFGE